MKRYLIFWIQQLGIAVIEVYGWDETGMKSFMLRIYMFMNVRTKKIFLGCFIKG